MCTQCADHINAAKSATIIDNALILSPDSAFKNSTNMEDAIIMAQEGNPRAPETLSAIPDYRNEGIAQSSGAS